MTIRKNFPSPQAHWPSENLRRRKAKLLRHRCTHFTIKLFLNSTFNHVAGASLAMASAENVNHPLKEFILKRYEFHLQQTTNNRQLIRSALNNSTTTKLHNYITTSSAEASAKVEQLTTIRPSSMRIYHIEIRMPSNFQIPNVNFQIT